MKSPSESVVAPRAKAPAGSKAWTVTLMRPVPVPSVTRPEIVPAASSTASIPVVVCPAVTPTSSASAMKRLSG